MFNINDNFRVEKDRFNWTLIETYEGKDKKTGAPKIKKRETYHPTLEKLCISMLDKSIEGGTLDLILESIHKAKFEIKVAIKEYYKEI